MTLIEGPPGTGKTRLIISMISQLLFGHELGKEIKILVLAPSNSAVDIITRRLLDMRNSSQEKSGKSDCSNCDSSNCKLFAAKFTDICYQ